MLRRLDRGEHRGLVLGRRQFALGHRIQQRQADAHQQCQAAGQPAVAQGELQDLPVAPRQAAEEPLGGAAHAPLVLVCLEQQRTHHRRQGQRHHPGHDHRARQGQGELAEQCAGEAAHQADGGVHGSQGDGHGDHRAGHFAGADQRRRHRRLAFLDVAVDVLHHHDGVVHHQPDGQHHRQQGQQVDAEAEGQHQRGGAEHRQGMVATGISTLRSEPRQR